MRLRVGYDVAIDCSDVTPVIVMLTTHYSRAADVVGADVMTRHPDIPVTAYRDSFGNWCTRLVAPAGRLTISGRATLTDHGEPDAHSTAFCQTAIEDLPAETLVFLLGSRYCDTDLLAETAWSLFGHAATGVARVRAVCDYVHGRLRFSYSEARATRTASEALHERVGVCRDFAHLAIAFCRCLNIPARYCTGYLGDIGVPTSSDPMDFAAWFEAYLDGRWYVFDPRNNEPRIGRVLVARGRDATDVPLIHAFGPVTLSRFLVQTDVVDDVTSP